MKLNVESTPIDSNSSMDTALIDKNWYESDTRAYIAATDKINVWHD